MRFSLNAVFSVSRTQLLNTSPNYAIGPNRKAGLIGMILPLALWRLKYQVLDGIVSINFPSQAGRISLRIRLDALYDLAAIQSPSTLVSLGFPPLDAVDPQLTSKVPSCGFNWTDTDGCDSSEALDLIVQQNPEFLPWDTPAYSNTQYQLIGRVLEILTNNKETYEKIMRTRVYEPLNLTRTWTFAPSDNEVGCGIREAGPKGELHEQAWSSSLGSEVPAGGSYMSINDMARHIRAVLTNEQLTRTQTRRWLKPSSFQGHMMGAVGMPWEIIRVDRETKGVYDVYRKDGGTPYYGESVYGIVDRWNVGYTVMMMFGEQRGDVAEVEEVIVTYLVKALEQAAESEAKENVAGRFVGDEGGAGNKSKNEIVVSVDDDGLFIERWSSNGTDFLESYKNIAMRKGAKDIRFGLHPSKADDKGGDKDIRQAYRFVLGGKPPWYGCHSWVELDLWRYAQEPLDELVFVKDSENGNVRSIEWLGGRVKLQRAE